MSASSPKNAPAGRRRREPLVAHRPAPSAPGTAHRAPPPVDPPGLRDSDGQWMTQAEAAEEAGVTLATVRRWRKSGTIAERPAPDKPGKVEVFLTADSRQPAATERDSSGGDDHDRGPQSQLGVLVPLEIHQQSLAELILRLTDTTERAVRAEAKLEVLEAKLAELQPSPDAPAGTLSSPPLRRRKKG